METQKNIKKHQNFLCESCDFVWSKKGDYKRHVATQKHKWKQMETHFTSKNIKPTFQACICGKKYKTRRFSFCVLSMFSLCVLSVFSFSCYLCSFGVLSLLLLLCFFLCVSLCVFALYVLCVLSLCCLWVFSVCVFSLCSFCVLSLCSFCVFSLCFFCDAWGKREGRRGER